MEIFIFHCFVLNIVMNEMGMRIYVIFFWDTYVLSDTNIATMISTCAILEYLTKTPINNKIAWTNSILQHTSIIAKYSASVTYSATVF